MRVFPTTLESVSCPTTTNPNIRISGIIEDSIVDGPGFRTVVFTQGCPRRCRGCHNPQTQDFDKGETRSVESILSIVTNNSLTDGITLSGGEPFCQTDACAALAKGVHEAGLSVWCYTGYTFEELVSGKENWISLLENIDVLVDGPFIIDEKTTDLCFRGSANQRIIDVVASLNKGEIVFSSYN